MPGIIRNVDWVQNKKRDPKILVNCKGAQKPHEQLLVCLSTSDHDTNVSQRHGMYVMDLLLQTLCACLAVSQSDRDRIWNLSLRLTSMDASVYAVCALLMSKPACARPTVMCGVGATTYQDVRDVIPCQ